MPRYTIVFEPLGKRVTVDEGYTIFNAALLAGIPIKTLCGGMGLCGKCRVKILNGHKNLSPLTEAEKRFLSEELINNNFRLACQTKVFGPVEIYLPDESIEGKAKILISGINTEFELEPFIFKHMFKINPPKEEMPISDIELLENEITSRLAISEISYCYDTLRNLPESLRKKNWEVTAVLTRGNKLLAVEPGNTLNNLYGVAIDIGTTTVVASLVDLNTGETIATESIMNPQIQYGEDVISRISYSERYSDGLQKLHEAIINGVNLLIDSLVSIANISKEDIYEVTIAGNTVMHHIFLGLSPKNIGRAPFLPVVRKSISINARKLGISINKHGIITALPNLAGFVGADTVAGILATKMYETKNIEMLIDIGTNGEIVLSKNNRLTVTSYAAGGAFEGVQIKYGMRAATGAIESFRFKDDTLTPEFSVIGNIEPAGFCGTALVDIIASLYRYDILLPNGRFNESVASNRLVKSDDGNLEFILIERKNKPPITITQKDIRQFQLAKAAMRAAIEILLKRTDTHIEDLSVMYIAGGFGSYLNIDNTKYVGMIPAIDNDKVKFVGNTSLSGAKVFLTSSKMRTIAESLSSKIEYINMGGDPDFYNAFLREIPFPAKGRQK